MADRNGYAMIAALAFTALLGGLASLAFMANTQLLRENLVFQERLLERARVVEVIEGGLRERMTRARILERERQRREN